MVTVGLFVRLEARPGKEADVEQFLRGGLTLVEDEPATAPGSAFGSDRRPLPFSMPSPTKQVDTRT